MRGDNMTKEELWNLFKKTGKIKYYLEYKKVMKDEQYDKDARRCYSK